MSEAGWLEASDRGAEAEEPGTGFLAAARGFRDGRDTPRALLERCLARMATAEGRVRAFVASDPAAARRAADAATVRHRDGRALSLLDGMPFAVKDVIETADLPTACNSPILAGWSGRRDAAAVAPLRRAGAVLVGKTVTTEFAVGAAGPTRNPRDLSRSPGGSSSGSAAAVAVGVVPVALGTQTQSSTLRPASYCGVVGYKPSHGALPVAGVHPLAPSMDHLGLLAGTLDDLWAAAGIAGGRPPLLPDALPPRRLGLLGTSGLREAEPEAREALARFAAALQAEGVEVADAAAWPALAAFEDALADADAVSEDILCFEMRWPFAAYRDAHGERLGRRVASLVARGEAMPDALYCDRLETRAALRLELARLAGDVDGFVALAAGGPAPVGPETDGPPPGARSFAIPASLLGAPAFSLPLLSAAGLPLGLQVIGPPGRDAALAGLARWFMRRPPVAAPPF